MPNNKPLSEMSSDEIAQLTPEQFKELADTHNDQLELRENAKNRELQTKAEALAELTNRQIEREIEQLDELPGHDLGQCFRYDDLKTEQERRNRQREAAIEDGSCPTSISALDGESVASGFACPAPVAVRAKWLTETFLDGPDNPLNYRDSREDIKWTADLTPTQVALLDNFETNQPTYEQQREILVTATDQLCGKGQDWLARHLPNPNPEVDKILSGLLEPREKPPLVQRIIDRIKQVPENIRARNVNFSPLLQHDDKPPSFLDGVLKRQREKEQLEAQRRANLTPEQRQAEDRQKQQDRDQDLERW